MIVHSVHRPIPDFRVVLILTALLQACTEQTHYAPVTVSNQAIVKKTGVKAADKKIIVRNQKESIDGNQNIISPNAIADVQNYHIVKTGETLYSIGISSGLGYERLAQWNQLPEPYRIVPGQQLKLFKPSSKNKNNIQEPRSVGSGGRNEPPDKPVKTRNDNRKPVAKPAFIKQRQPAPVNRDAKIKEKKSIISIDNKKMLKLSFAWPIKGRISRNFTQSNKKGIDIAGKIGQKVRAAESGKIVYSGQGLIGFGNLVIIKHNDTYLSAYGNNSRLWVNEGELVEKGQVIANVGQALSKKAALHFEIRENGKPVNPLSLLPKGDKTL